MALLQAWVAVVLAHLVLPHRVLGVSGSLHSVGCLRAYYGPEEGAGNLDSVGSTSLFAFTVHRPSVKAIVFCALADFYPNLTVLHSGRIGAQILRLLYCLSHPASQTRELGDPGQIPSISHVELRTMCSTS